MKHNIYYLYTQHYDFDQAFGSVLIILMVLFLARPLSFNKKILNIKNEKNWSILSKVI